MLLTSVCDDTRMCKSAVGMTEIIARQFIAGIKEIPRHQKGLGTNDLVNTKKFIDVKEDNHLTKELSDVSEDTHIGDEIKDF